MCTIGVIDNKILFKNYDWAKHSEVKIKKLDNRIEVFCPIIGRPVAVLTKSGIGIVSTLVPKHKGIAPIPWLDYSKINSADDVIALLKQGADFTGFVLIIADKNKAYVVELYGKQINIAEVTTAVRTTYFFKLKEGPTFEEEPVRFMRHKRAETLIKIASPDIESAKHILKDHGAKDSREAICRHSTNSYRTNSSIVMDLPNATLYYTKGNPCENEFIEVKC